jgi:hypothetical protein
VATWTSSQQSPQPGGTTHDIAFHAARLLSSEAKMAILGIIGRPPHRANITIVFRDRGLTGTTCIDSAEIALERDLRNWFNEAGLTLAVDQTADDGAGIFRVFSFPLPASHLVKLIVELLCVGFDISDDDELCFFFHELVG